MMATGYTQAQLGAYASDSPAARGWREWNYSPDLMFLAAQPAAGTQYGMSLTVQNTQTISNLHVFVNTIGSGWVANQSIAALFDAAGTRLAVSVADLSAVLGSTVGVATIALGSPIGVTAGQKIGAVLMANATTMPFLGRVNSIGAHANAGLTAAGGLRYFTIASGQTSMPTSYVPGSTSLSPLSFWVALS